MRARKVLVEMLCPAGQMDSAQHQIPHAAGGLPVSTHYRPAYFFSHRALALAPVAVLVLCGYSRTTLQVPRTNECVPPALVSSWHSAATPCLFLIVDDEADCAPFSSSGSYFSNCTFIIFEKMYLHVLSPVSSTLVMRAPAVCGNVQTGHQRLARVITHDL